MLLYGGLGAGCFAAGVGPSPSALVEAFVNRNPPPRLVKWQGLYPVFPTDFDWPEDGRVHRSLRTLIEHAEAAWPEMVRHLDDARYCATVDEALSCEYAMNWTVGDVCREIIAGSLTRCYLTRLGPLDKMTFVRLENRPITADAKKLRAWCEARSALPLYEIQIGACRAVLAEVEGGGWPPAAAERRRQRAAEIEAVIQSLRASRTAYHFAGFGESMRG